MSLLLALSACSSAPSKEQVKESIKKIMPVSFEVVEVRELKEVPGLYQVVLQAGKQPLVVYMDKKAKYLLSGTLLSVATKTNLTMQVQQRYMKQ
jgi:hypothetical protein